MSSLTADILLTQMTPTWWRLALGSDLGITCLLIMLVGTGLLVLALHGLVHLRPSASGPVRPIGPESGVATLEFCLVFPVVLFLGLLLAQTTTLMGANMVVHYSAFAATRTAIVQIPADYSVNGEPANELMHAPGYRKYDAIRGAAVTALWPVAGRMRTGDVPADVAARRVGEHFAAYGMAEPPWVQALLADRLRYAADVINTEVNVFFYEPHMTDPHGIAMRPGERAVFGPRDPVTVNVRHRLNLSVPYIRALFASGNHPSNIRGMYATVNARYTLTNEGIERDLPPLPMLDRDP